MANTNRRSFGALKEKTIRGNVYLEASYPTPAYALAENPQLPQRYYKTLAPQFKAELEMWLAEAQKQIALNTWTPPVRLNKKELDVQTMTFAELADMYMRNIRKPNGEKLEETTQSHKEGRLRNYLLPAFGSKPITAITSNDVQRWYDNFDCDERTGRNVTARSHCYSLLRSIFNYACKTTLDNTGKPLLERTPCTLKLRKPKTRHESKVASVQQLKDLYDSMPANMRVAVIIGGACGLREGEICALTTADIDLTSMRINVDKSLKYVHYHGQKGRLEVGKPKTESSIRKVPIPKWTLPYLEAHIRQNMHSNPDEILIHTKNDTHINPSKLREAFNRALHSVPELKDMHFHDLRHTALTHYGEAGASIAELMEVAGHSDLATVARYQNISKEQRERTARQLNQQAATLITQPASQPTDNDRDPLVNLVSNLDPQNMVQVLRSLDKQRQASIIAQLPTDVQIQVLPLLL